MVRPQASFHKHERSRKDGICLSKTLREQLGCKVQTSSSAGVRRPGTLPGWHHWKSPGRPALLLQYQHKGQAKGSFTNLGQTRGKPTIVFVFPLKGTHMENKGICSRWQGRFSRPLESHLQWEHPESTESQTKVR